MGELILPEAKTLGAEMILLKRGVLASVAPSWLEADRFLMMAMIEANNPTLANSYGPSTVKAAMNCAVVGLMPGEAMGHAFFVPFRNKREGGRQETQLVIGYKGYLDLAFRSGFLSAAHPEVIVYGEEFELWNDETGPKMRHVLTPRYKGESPQPDRSNIIGAYCVYSTKVGGRGIAGVTRKEIDQIDTQKNVWKANYPAMCRKTAIRRAAKEWRVTLEFEQAALLDGLAERDEPQPQLAVVGDMEAEPAAAFDLSDLPEIEVEEPTT